MTIVYRVENKDRRGPYAPCGIYGTFSGQHPHPADDIPDWESRWNERRWTFGFDSLSHLEAWFPSKNVRSELDRLGYAVSEYAVNAELVIRGEHQLAFCAESASLLCRYPLENGLRTSGMGKLAAALATFTG